MICVYVYRCIDVQVVVVVAVAGAVVAVVVVVVVVVFVLVAVVVFCCNVSQTLLPLHASPCCWPGSVDSTCMWAPCMLYVGCSVCRLYVYIDM